ncbi:hypothetical protein [Paenibacillus alvei]|uniref:hypothetical protein n=1 Tax=Paenibacillus alvei TaxID=44250 RepID=UPI0013D99519|nr:hypothetical protein [Paenibacillus alvei]NEZ44409.1 hypothetical protein [Paenibacillus alvei]
MVIPIHLCGYKVVLNIYEKIAEVEIGEETKIVSFGDMEEKVYFSKKPEEIAALTLDMLKLPYKKQK